jgi:hypothetical protein
MLVKVISMAESRLAAEGIRFIRTSISPGTVARAHAHLIFLRAASMTIERPDVVDGLGIDKISGEAVLLISDHLKWDDEEAHLAALEAKIGGYIDFIRSGQLLERLPASDGRRVRISLIHEHAPSSTALAVLDEVRQQLLGWGISFSHGSLDAQP